MPLAIGNSSTFKKVNFKNIYDYLLLHCSSTTAGWRQAQQLQSPSATCRVVARRESDLRVSNKQESIELILPSLYL